MPRGRGWYAYIDDNGLTWAVRVDRDYAADPGRGWVSLEDPSVPQLARGWLPRRVFGHSSDGVLYTTRVATTDAPLWTGAQATFQVETTDQLLVDVQVIGRHQERRVRVQ